MRRVCRVRSVGCTDFEELVSLSDHEKYHITPDLRAKASIGCTHTRVPSAVMALNMQRLNKGLWSADRMLHCVSLLALSLSLHPLVLQQAAVKKLTSGGGNKLLTQKKKINKPTELRRKRRINQHLRRQVRTT